MRSLGPCRPRTGWRSRSCARDAGPTNALSCASEKRAMNCANRVGEKSVFGPEGPKTLFSPTRFAQFIARFSDAPLDALVGPASRAQLRDLQPVLGRQGPSERMARRSPQALVSNRELALRTGAHLAEILGLAGGAGGASLGLYGSHLGGAALGGGMGAGLPLFLRELAL